MKNEQKHRLILDNVNRHVAAGNLTIRDLQVIVLMLTEILRTPDARDKILDDINAGIERRDAINRKFYDWLS